MSLKVWVEYIFMSLKMLTAVLKTAILSVWRDKSAHNAIAISMLTWRATVSAASQGAFVAISETSHSDIFMHD